MKSASKLFSSKSYSDDKDRSRRGSQLLLEGSRRDAENRIIPRIIDADDSDGETNNNDERVVLLELNPDDRKPPEISDLFGWTDACVVDLK